MLRNLSIGWLHGVTQRLETFSKVDFRCEETAMATTDPLPLAGGVAEGAAELVRSQHTVLRGSRLGIPALVHEECLTGFTTHGATVYPTAIAWAATFDPDLVRRMGAAIGRDMRAVGVHQGLAPLLD